MWERCAWCVVCVVSVVSVMRVVSVLSLVLCVWGGVLRCCVVGVVVVFDGVVAVVVDVGVTVVAPPFVDVEPGARPRCRTRQSRCTGGPTFHGRRRRRTWRRAGR